MIATVGQFIVLNKETQVSHLPNLQLRGLWWVSVIRDVKITSLQSGGGGQWLMQQVGVVLTEGRTCSLVH